MRNRFSSVFLIILAATLLISACSSGASNPTATSVATPALNAALLIQERCSVCHSLERIITARHTAAEWKTLVATMIGRGAILNLDEENAVVSYLAANYGK